MTSIDFFPKLTRRLRHTFNTCFLMAMALCIFGRSPKINWANFSGFAFLLTTTYFLGDVKYVQNNYIVHMLYLSFTPLMIALQAKY